MKNLKKVIMLAMVCIATTVNATVRTVSNLGGSQYPDLSTAYGLANSGDTLMIEGSGTSYSIGASWAKSLVVIGAGINANKQNFMPSTITSGAFTTGSSGCKFYGITFPTNVLPQGIGNIQFEDCLIQGTVDNGTTAYSNWSFRNCVFTGGANFSFTGSGTHSNISIINCILNGYIYMQAPLFSNFVVDHCIFLFSTGFGPTNNIFTHNGSSFPALNNIILKNSIIVNTGGVISQSCPTCSFINNLSRLNVGWGPPNINNASTLAFTNYTNGSLWSTAWDFHCSTPAAVVNGGDDATDIGVHGGTAKFSEKGEPLNVDVVRIVNVTNTAAPNGTLNVNITAGKPTDQ